MNKPSRALSAAAGYVSDVYRLARGQPRNPHSYLKYLTLHALGRRTGARTLVETGTFLGVTAARCARSFERVVTIELDVDLAARARRFLSRYQNVTVLQGDAVELLPTVLADSGCDRAVAFLDGHFSGGVTACGPVVEPAIEELEILSGHTAEICGIVIDDFRLFGHEPGFPSKSTLILAVERLFPPPQFAFTVQSDQLVIERCRE